MKIRYQTILTWVAIIMNCYTITTGLEPYSLKALIVILLIWYLGLTVGVLIHYDIVHKNNQKIINLK